LQHTLKTLQKRFLAQGTPGPLITPVDHGRVAPVRLTDGGAQSRFAFGDGDQVDVFGIRQ
jgi:hypothetical protein